MLDILLLLFAQSQAPRKAPAARPVPCVLTDTDKRANAALSFGAFDQQGTLPSSARALSGRGCWREAANATADYLIRGPVAAPREQRVLLFHLGQYSAMGGDEKRAATVIAATRELPSDRDPDDPLRWNDYVKGTWAFLVKDRSALIASRDAVLAGSGHGNAANGALLAGLERCLSRPYAIAYDRNCGR